MGCATCTGCATGSGDAGAGVASFFWFMQMTAVTMPASAPTPISAPTTMRTMLPDVEDEGDEEGDEDGDGQDPVAHSSHREPSYIPEQQQPYET